MKTAVDTLKPHLGGRASRRRATSHAIAVPRRHASARPPSAPHAQRPRVASRIGQLLLLTVLGASLLAAVPSLRPVLSAIAHIDPAWVAAAIALEIASCVSFVILFRLFFDRLRPSDARALAWTEMASGALLPGGGAGGLAIGGWLIHMTGASTGWIVRRSGGLFFLTSAVNSAAIITGGLLLTLGAPGPHGFTLAALPALLAAVATLAVAALPRVLGSRVGGPRWLRGLNAGVRDAEETAFSHPSWRLVGAFGYLGFDIAVLGMILHALGEPIGIPALLLAYNIGYLGSALPIPGGIGVLDAGLAGALLLYGAPPARVAAAVLVYHAIALWTPGLAGTVAYIRLRSRLSRAPRRTGSAVPAFATSSTAS